MTVAVLGKFQKQPGEILDYDVDFTDWFSNRTDAPASVAAFCDAGITLVSMTRTGFVVKLIISGGTDGTKYHATVRMTTTAGLIKEADFTLTIKEV